MKIDILQHSEGSFNHEQFGEIRMLIDEQGEPWFVGMDVAAALGYNSTRDALRKHVEKEDKTTVAICDGGSNYKTRAVIINESGLYALILSSKLLRQTRKHVEEKDELTRQIVVSGQKPFNHPKYGGSMGESTRAQICALAKMGRNFD